MIVIKYGGHAMTDKNGIFSQAIAKAIANGVELVIVHGGGPQVDVALKREKISTQSIGGFRVTTPEIFEVVEKVLSGQVGPMVVSALQSVGVRAQAVSGMKSKTLFAKKLMTLVDGTPVDLGLAGEIIRVDTSFMNSLLSNGITPVVSPTSNNEYGEGGLNVNGDISAAAIAGTLGADALIIMTDVEGIYRSWPDKSSLISQISATELESLISTFEEGMAPKVKACLDAVASGALAVRIIDGTNPDALSHALAGTGGTLVTK